MAALKLLELRRGVQVPAVVLQPRDVKPNDDHDKRDCAGCDCCDCADCSCDCVN